MADTQIIDPAIAAQYEPVIGLEVHAQLLTRTKAFSFAATEYGPTPNTATDPVVLGHPGTLPVVNIAMIEFALRMGFATHCSIRLRSHFARKNYFYPDLPKGYQISQSDEPLCYDGWVEIEPEEGALKRIGVTRIHIEEDAGKSIHDIDINNTLVDLNRAGTPLIEVVSEPDIRSSREAYLYLTEVKSILTYLGICSGNMEEGALRCDANVSVRKKGQAEFGVKTEVKNMNSFRNVEKAIEYEIARQIALLESGGRVEQVTCLWDGTAKVTRPMRSKEFAHDYRYFPEPDLPPLVLTPELLQRVQDELPELAVARKNRFTAQYGIPRYDAGVLTETRALGDFFEQCCAALKNPDTERYKLVSNVIMTEVMRVLGEQKADADQAGIRPEHIAELAELYADARISSKNMKDIFAELVGSDKSPEQISTEKGFIQISDTTFIQDAVNAVVAEKTAQVEAYRNGKQGLFGFFVGETIKRTQGKANPKMVSELLRKALG